jgi:hypothetical protein
MAVTAQIEQDRPADPSSLQRNASSIAPHRVIGFRRWQDALDPGEQHPGLETTELVIGAGFDQTQFLDVTDQRGHAVIAQSAGMETGRSES